MPRPDEAPLPEPDEDEDLNVREPSGVDYHAWLHANASVERTRTIAAAWIVCVLLICLAAVVIFA